MGGIATSGTVVVTVPAGGGEPGTGPAASVLAQTLTAVRTAAAVTIAERISLGRVRKRWRLAFGSGEGSGSGSCRLRGSPPVLSPRPGGA
ncbi:hypothetical protein [Microbispora sp. CA-102843]|uniref:hypothetical protein n=1 Tax=Microbispora sp. CA-102843 TaxID=3239952 RepID=UPI003D9467A5